MAERIPSAGRMGRREALKITAVAGLSAAFGGGLTAGILRDAGLHRISRTRIRMGTLVTLTVVHHEPESGLAMIESGFREMARLEGVLSRHRPTAALARLNAESRLALAPTELVGVLRDALELARATDGAFDPTVLPVLEAYQRAFAATGRPPSDREVRAARGLVGHAGVSIEGRRITLHDPRMAVTLDGIAKGFIVDRTVDVLTAGGAERVLVDAGGDIATAGKGSEDDPWTVAVQHPHGRGESSGILRLGGRSVATSGDYMNSFTADRRFHHIVDPRTGRSPDAVSSVSVIAPTAMRADGLSTAVMVLGPKLGVELLDGLGGVEGFLVTKTGRRLRTEGLSARFA